MCGHRGGILPYDARPHAPPEDVVPPPPARVALALPLAACGEQKIEVPATARSTPAPSCSSSAARAATRSRPPPRRAPPPTSERASARTGRTSTRRRECIERVLYAIANGGFSGAIMPQNIVVGEQAQQVAEFVAGYAGADATARGRPAAAAGQRLPLHRRARRGARTSATPTRQTGGDAAGRARRPVLDLRLIRSDPEAVRTRSRVAVTSTPARSTRCSRPTSAGAS